jgi:predicted DNA-binding transcriptional regulator YafY
MRRKKRVTAEFLAEDLEVSARTIYRDIQDLCASGVPIRGEAGLGYELEKGLDLPPLMFREEELEALALGARLVKAWGDPELARAADAALARVELVLPEGLRDQLTNLPLFAPDFHISERHTVPLTPLRAAIREQRYVQLMYRDKSGEVSQRRIRPLGLFFWGSSWSLAAWCELRQDFRSFKLERIVSLETEDCTFEFELERSLETFLEQVEAR